MAGLFVSRGVEHVGIITSVILQDLCWSGVVGFSTAVIAPKLSVFSCLFGKGTNASLPTKCMQVAP